MCVWGGIEGQFNTHIIGSVYEESIMCDWEFHDYMVNLWLFIDDEYNDNNIGDSGGSVIGEGLKFNSTLTELRLGLRS